MDRTPTISSASPSWAASTSSAFDGPRFGLSAASESSDAAFLVQELQLRCDNLEKEVQAQKNRAEQHTTLAEQSLRRVEAAEATLGQREREIERLRVEADACEVELEEERENQSLVAVVAQQRGEEAASEIARLKQQIAELTSAAGRHRSELAEARKAEAVQAKCTEREKQQAERSLEKAGAAHAIKVERVREELRSAERLHEGTVAEKLLQERQWAQRLSEARQQLITLQEELARLQELRAVEQAQAERLQQGAQEEAKRAAATATEREAALQEAAASQASAWAETEARLEQHITKLNEQVERESLELTSARERLDAGIVKRERDLKEQREALQVELEASVERERAESARKVEDALATHKQLTGVMEKSTAEAVEKARAHGAARWEAEKETKVLEVQVATLRAEAKSNEVALGECGHTCLASRERQLAAGPSSSCPALS